MEIKKCQSYHAKLVDKTTLEMPDGKSFFKVYFLSIIGRKNPERFEWNIAGQQYLTWLEKIKTLKLEGVGFITAFPHITKIFRFAPSAEIVLYVKAYNTKEFTELSLEREENFVEFACLAEAIIAAAEYQKWAQSQCVEEYKNFFCAFDDYHILNHSKLFTFFEKN